MSAFIELWGVLDHVCTHSKVLPHSLFFCLVLVEMFHFVYCKRHLMQNERQPLEQCDGKILSHVRSTVPLAGHHLLASAHWSLTTKFTIVQSCRSNILLSAVLFLCVFCLFICWDFLIGQCRWGHQLRKDSGWTVHFKQKPTAESHMLYVDIDCLSPLKQLDSVPLNTFSISNSSADWGHSL